MQKNITKDPYTCHPNSSVNIFHNRSCYQNQESNRDITHFKKKKKLHVHFSSFFILCPLLYWDLTFVFILKRDFPQILLVPLLCSIFYSVLVLCKGMWQDRYVRGYFMGFSMMFSFFIHYRVLKFVHSLSSYYTRDMCVSMCALLFFVLENVLGDVDLGNCHCL